MSCATVAHRALRLLGTLGLAATSVACTRIDWISLPAFCDGAERTAIFCEDFEDTEPGHGSSFLTTSTAAAAIDPDSARGGHVALLSLEPVAGGGEAVLLSPHLEGLERFTTFYRVQIVAADAGEFLLLDQVRIYPEPTYNVELFSTPDSLRIKEIVPDLTPPEVEHSPDSARAFPAGWVEVEHSVDLVAGTTQVRLDGETWLTADLSDRRKQGSVVVAIGIAYAMGAANVTLKLDDVRITAE